MVLPSLCHLLHWINKGKCNLFCALEAQHFFYWCVTTIIIFIVSITLLSMQVMHCEYFILIKPSITSYRTLFAQLNLHSWLAYWEVTDETLKKNKDKPGNAMLPTRISAKNQTNKQIRSLLWLLRSWSQNLQVLCLRCCMGIQQPLERWHDQATDTVLFWIGFKNILQQLI